MNWPTRAFCRVVLLLDYIPRYGRHYVYDADQFLVALEDRDGPLTKKPVWSWQRQGLWGFYLLDRMGLLWRYVDYCEEHHAHDDVQVSG